MFKSLAPILLATLLSGHLSSQTVADSTGLPGDHFSLEAALELFKKASSPEDFERVINEEDNLVNNLDLNEDGNIDYLQVIDEADGESHALIIRSVISEGELQDVAVIGLEKDGNESAVIQIIGDEELYGEEVLVEPYDEKAGGGKGGPAVMSEPVQIVVNVWMWPCVRFVYSPQYRPWISPYYWSHFPGWWKPWRVHPWRWHHQRCAIYYPHYHRASVLRVSNARSHYRVHRRTSPFVHDHCKAAHENYRASRSDRTKSGNMNGQRQGGRTGKVHGNPGSASDKAVKQKRNGGKSAPGTPGKQGAARKGRK